MFILYIYVNMQPKTDGQFDGNNNKYKKTSFPRKFSNCCSLRTKYGQLYFCLRKTQLYSKFSYKNPSLNTQIIISMNHL